MVDAPVHLLLPLSASLLFVSGLIFIKRVSESGVNPWMVTFIANQWAALLFSALWLLGGDLQPLSQLWQPLVVAGLYILGQVFTFAAIKHGDVSVATPVFGIKVVLVALLLTMLFGQRLSSAIWVSAAMAAIGISLVQWNPASGDRQEPRKSPLLAVALALLAATSFATFDVLVQHWARAWGAGRLLPVTFWIVGVLSFCFLPYVDPRFLRDRPTRVWLLSGTFLVGMQAICLVSALAIFGDAARVNVVYAMRGMWGVLLAFLVAKRWGGSEASLPSRVMFARFLGATLLTAAVVLVIVSGRL